MTTWTFLNNDFIEDQAAVLHYKDLAFQRAYGLFDFFRVSDNSPRFLKDHLIRFHASANGLHLPVPFSSGAMETIIQELIHRNNMSESGIRLSLSGGASVDGYSIAQPNFIISQHPIKSPGKEQVDKGIKLLSYPYQRQLSHIKTIDYLMAILLQPLLQQKGFDDLLYHHNSVITECPRSNFFIITKDDILVTPRHNILQGITRMKILEIGRQQCKIEERNITLEEVKMAKEAFITSTIKQVLPVAQIDDTLLPQCTISIQLLNTFLTTYDATTT